MKTIGLVIADDNEIHNYSELVFIEQLNDQNFKIKKYSLNNICYILVIYSGIGLVNSSIATQHLIDKYSVVQIWNYGAVGSIGELNIYDVVKPKKFFFFDVITPWYKRGQTPGEKEYFENSFENCENFNIASGNSFLSDSNYINDLKKEIDVHMIDMESCAIAQTCYKNNVPFFCIKAISDIIGKNHVMKQQINEVINKASKLAFEKTIEEIKNNI